ncbi:GntR family transcriptional regulator [Nitratireductor sp. ZSWI3]|uniref:GntR family transcriptional regulator n=1 Tax=Nitratireductor sp. ZSWI3 TaxID=2966359 RepID=UPI00214FDD80|nr:GntR family transcriptional regulator [Nitratireductor sp. ZSWI3]MCR4267600.1 GntR family transcriptional regulator [Nitratireductor sp. ZSWI3]
MKTVHSEFIAAQLEREIIDQLWPVGAKLDESALAKRFGVSRTPIREALHIVVSRSLAQRVPYKGVVVVDVGRERIDQMFEAMGEIEATCGRLAATRMTMSERTELEMLHQQMRRMAELGDFRGYDETNAKFHTAIYAGAHNADLMEIAELTRLKLAPFRSSQLQQAERVARSNAEHETIISAILDRNAKEAERALRRHLTSAAKAVLAGRLRAG